MNAIITEMTVELGKNELISLEDSDVYYCFQDLWRFSHEGANMDYQDIDANARQTYYEVSGGSC